MSAKFNPAPPDRHAEPAHKAPKTTEDGLGQGLEDTFPASDPPSSTQPGPNKRTK